MLAKGQHPAGEIEKAGSCASCTDIDADKIAFAACEACEGSVAHDFATCIRNGLARGVMPSALLASEIDAVRKDRQIAKPESMFKGVHDGGAGGYRAERVPRLSSDLAA